MSNIFFSVRSDVFIMEFWLFWKFLPMNVADSIVTAINIPQIVECSSPSPAAFEILFCLFRTSSFTRFTNSVASLPMMKFWEFATSWELTLSGCPDLSRSGSPYLTDCAVPSRRGSPLWRQTCCNTLQKALSGCPDRSCVVPVALIDRASYPQLSTLEKTKHGHNPILNNPLKKNYQVSLIYLLQQRTSKDLVFRNISSPGSLKWKMTRTMAS